MKEEIKHCNNCVFIGIYHCFHPNGDYGKKKSFSEEEGLNCKLWQQGLERPKLEEYTGFCSKCGKLFPVNELTNQGKGISLCKECI
jgi:hypothetical protein